MPGSSVSLWPVTRQPRSFSVSSAEHATDASTYTCANGCPKWISSYGIWRISRVRKVTLPHAATTAPTLPPHSCMRREVVMMM
eukprot:jgi/Chrpa1/23160/Chrysochromulina_OHIO_Genome00006964-RA